MLNSEPLNFTGKRKEQADVLQPIYLKNSLSTWWGISLFFLIYFIFLLNLFYFSFLPEIQQLVASTSAQQLFTWETVLCLMSSETSHAKQNITVNSKKYLIWSFLFVLRTCICQFSFLCWSHSLHDLNSSVTVTCFSTELQKSLQWQFQYYLCTFAEEFSYLLNNFIK